MDKKSCHVLVVDDNHINRQFLASALSQAGHENTATSSGKHALELSDSIAFDLILMDVQMPRLNGIETTELLKSSDKNSQTPVIAVSSEPISESDSHHFTSALLKPVHFDDVINCINTFCTASRFFDHNKALLASHNDEAIVVKLRELFIQDLPSQLDKAGKLLQNKQIESLQSQLHYILGGAQVCAAESLIQLITELKHALKTTGLIDKTSENLWQEINAVNLAMQRSKK